jgi:L-malate glycosyltransferase
MRVAVVSMIRDAWGGSEELWAAMAMEAVKSGDACLHISYNTGRLHPKVKALQDNNVTLLRRPSYIKGKHGFAISFLKRVRFFFKKRLDNTFRQMVAWKPDVVIYNGTCTSVLAEKKLYGALKNLPGTFFFIIGHFVEENPMLSDIQIETLKKVYQQCTALFFVSQRSIDVMTKLLGIPVKGRVVRNPVNMGDTGIIPFPTTQSVHLAVVGNLRIAHKGQDMLLACLADDFWLNKDWYLNIYGSGEDEALLKALVLAYKLTHRVIFHGKVDDIRALWQHNHILLMPSHMEGMPLAVVEAMLCGRAVVATDVGGHCEWITDGVEGFIVPVATVDALQQTLLRAWALKEQWPLMGQNASKKAHALYDANAGASLRRLIKQEMIGYKPKG